MDGDDVGMIQRRGSLCFLHEALHPVGMSGDFSGQNLQRDSAIEFGIKSEIDLAHPALTNLRVDFITTESSASDNSQRVFSQSNHCGSPISRSRSANRESERSTSNCCCLPR